MTVKEEDDVPPSRPALALGQVRHEMAAPGNPDEKSRDEEVASKHREHYETRHSGNAARVMLPDGCEITYKFIGSQDSIVRSTHCKLKHLGRDENSSP